MVKCPIEGSDFSHDGVMTWKCFPHYWLSLRGSTEHGWPSSQNCWAPMFSTLLAKASCWTNSWVVSDLKHYDTYVTSPLWSSCFVSDKLKHVSIKIPLNVILIVGWLSWLSLYDLGGGGGGGGGGALHFKNTYGLYKKSYLSMYMMYG